MVKKKKKKTYTVGKQTFLVYEPLNEAISFQQLTNVLASQV